MWRAIDNISKEVQELVHGGASTDGGEEIEPMPASFDLVEEELVRATELPIPP